MTHDVKYLPTYNLSTNLVAAHSDKSEFSFLGENPNQSTHASRVFLPYKF